MSRRAQPHDQRGTGRALRRTIFVMSGKLLPQSSVLAKEWLGLALRALFSTNRAPLPEVPSRLQDRPYTQRRKDE